MTKHEFAQALRRAAEVFHGDTQVRLATMDDGLLADICQLIDVMVVRAFATLADELES